MKIKVPEAEILRTPIKIEKLSLWNRSGGEFIMNFEFHGFLRKKHSLPVQSGPVQSGLHGFPCSPVSPVRPSPFWSLVQFQSGPISDMGPGLVSDPGPVSGPVQSRQIQSGLRSGRWSRLGRVERNTKVISGDTKVRRGAFS